MIKNIIRSVIYIIHIIFLMNQNINFSIKSIFILILIQLYQFLKLNKSIYKLSLSNISNIYIDYIIKVMMNKIFLKKLELSVVKIENFDYLLNIINYNKITVLNLYHIFKYNIDFLLPSLKNNNSINTLILTNNKINNIDKLLLILTIKINLKELDLLFNLIKNINILKYLLNNNITNIKLNNNKIQNIRSLYDLLLINKTIQSISLSNNYITNISSSLIELLKNNRSLKNLFINNNRLKDITQLLKLKMKNKKLNVCFDLKIYK